MGKRPFLPLSHDHDASVAPRRLLPDRWRNGLFAHWLHSLRQRADWRGRWHKRGLVAAKYLARSLAMAKRHGRYLAFVHNEPRMRAYRERDPRLLERHFHRYVNQHWGRRQRLHQLHGHYRYLLARWPVTLFEAVYVHGGAELGQLALKDGSTVRLSLKPPIFLGCEGELCIQLGDTHDRPLYRIVCSVIDGGKALAIGCIQGPEGANAQERVRELTRNMHGLRPKQLMLDLACALARHDDIHEVLAVSNAAHPLRHRRKHFPADYDTFWREQQGYDLGNGWYALPTTRVRKSEAQVPSAHRAAFRRRETLREDAERLLLCALGPGLATTAKLRVDNATMPRASRRLPCAN